MDKDRNEAVQKGVEVEIWWSPFFPLKVLEIIVIFHRMVIMIKRHLVSIELLSKNRVNDQKQKDDSR